MQAVIVETPPMGSRSPGARPAIRMSGPTARSWSADGGPAAQQGKPRRAAPAHQGGAVIVAMGLMSAITSTSSRESLANARQSAMSASLS